MLIPTGIISKGSFSKIIDAAATMYITYGFEPADADLYKTEAEKDSARQKSFIPWIWGQLGLSSLINGWSSAENTLL